MEPQQRKATGRTGEEAAQRHLEACGYRVVDINVRFGARSGLVGELDVVAWDGPTLCFVEVKTRRGLGGARGRRPGGDTPAESVTPAKQRQIARLALAYAARHGLLAEDGPESEAVSLRFDVAAVTLLSPPGSDGGEAAVCRVELIRGAFLAPDDFSEGY